MPPPERGKDTSINLLAACSGAPGLTGRYRNREGALEYEEPWSASLVRAGFASILGYYRSTVHLAGIEQQGTAFALCISAVRAAFRLWRSFDLPRNPERLHTAFGRS